MGIDIQQIRPVHPNLAARILTEGEQAQAGSTEENIVLFWALKEAAIKARRLAWNRALKEIAVTLTIDGMAEIMIAGEQKPLRASYCHAEGCWLARAVRPPDAV